MRDSADLLVYGCNLAATSDGQVLTEALSALCDCDVAASDDDTGHAALGGDWHLEYATGVIEVGIAFSEDLQSNWSHLMALETVRDEFNAVGFAGNDGSDNWTNAWTEVGESDGPASGKVYIGTQYGQQGMFTGKNVEAWRQADLSGATTATLSFDYARVGLSAGEWGIVEMSTDGVVWTPIANLTNPLADTQLVGFSINIDAYIDNDTRIRFDNNFGQGNDWLFVDNVQIEHDGAGSNDPPTGSVNIFGTPTEDQVLTASNSLADPDGLGPITYQWQRGGVDITGATASTYTLGDTDVGTMISVVASYTDGQGTLETVSSSSAGPIANINDLPTGDVTISGTPTEDQVLTAGNTLADVDGLGTVTYQWKRDGVDIGGATGATITLGDADVGTMIAVVASYMDGHGTDESVNSVAVGPIANVNDAPVLNAVANQDVDEDAAIGTTVVTVSASDADAADTLTFAIVSGNTNGDFAIVANGTITVNNPLDFSATSIYHLVIEVTDSGTPALTDTVTVTIEVTVPVAPPAAPEAPEDSGEEEEMIEAAESVADSADDSISPPESAAPGSEAAAPQEESPAVVAIDTAVAPEEQDPALEYLIRTVLDEVPEANDLRGGLAGSSRDHIITDLVPQPAYNYVELARDLEEMREELEQPADQQFFSAATAMGTTGSFTVGYVLWALRSGWLASSVLAQMPAWRLMDPLVVLSSLDGTDGEGEGEDDSLQAMLKKGVDTDADADPRETETKS